MPSACSISIVCFESCFDAGRGNFSFAESEGKAKKFFEDFSLKLYSSKTSHREVLLGCANRKFLKGAFLLQKPRALAREIERSSISCRATTKQNFAERLSATWRLTIKYFERCDARPKALPLETAAFWKRLAKTLCFYNPSFSRRGAWSFFFAYFLFLPKRK